MFQIGNKWYKGKFSAGGDIFNGILLNTYVLILSSGRILISTYIVDIFSLIDQILMQDLPN